MGAVVTGRIYVLHPQLAPAVVKAETRFLIHCSRYGNQLLEWLTEEIACMSKLHVSAHRSLCISWFLVVELVAVSTLDEHL